MLFRSARKKLFFQAVVSAFLVLASDSIIHSFGNLAGTGDLHPPQLAGILLTTFCVVGLINALNMIDGMDGLAGGVGLVSAIGLAASAHMAGQPQAFQLISAFAASIAGFLLFNFRLPWQRQARVFLGDAGSNLVGLALAYFAVLVTQDHSAGGAALDPI